MNTISVRIDQANNALMLAEWLKNIRFVKEVDVRIDAPMTKEEMFAKIDEGIAEYKAGKTKTLSSKEEIHNFLNS